MATKETHGSKWYSLCRFLLQTFAAMYAVIYLITLLFCVAVILARQQFDKYVIV